MRRKIGPAIGLLITIALLVYVFRQVDLHRVVAELGRAARWTVPSVIALLLLVFAADSFAMWKTFGWFAAPLRLGDVVLVRGATYLLALVNYAVGQGAIVYFIRRSRGVPIARSSATVLLIMGINVLALLAFASVGLAISGVRDQRVLALVVAGYLGFGVYLTVIKLRPAFLTRIPLLQVLFEAGAVGHLKAFVVRVPHISVLIALQYTILHAFGVRIPILHAFIYLPIVFLTALVPSFLGLGPVQAATIALMSRYAPGGPASIAAATFTAWALGIFVQVAIALVCLRSQLTQGLAKEVATS